MAGHQLVLHTAAGRRVSLESLASAAQVHPRLVERYVDYGLLDPLPGKEPVPWFDPAAVRRLQKIRRLRADLGINLAGIAVVLDLLDHIEQLQRELARYRSA